MAKGRRIRDLVPKVLVDGMPCNKETVGVVGKVVCSLSCVVSDALSYLLTLQEVLHEVEIDHLEALHAAVPANLKSRLSI